MIRKNASVLRNDYPVGKGQNQQKDAGMHFLDRAALQQLTPQEQEEEFRAKVNFLEQRGMVSNLNMFSS